MQSERQTTTKKRKEGNKNDATSPIKTKQNKKGAKHDEERRNQIGAIEGRFVGGGFRMIVKISVVDDRRTVAETWNETRKKFIPGANKNKYFIKKPIELLQANSVDPGQ